MSKQPDIDDLLSTQRPGEGPFGKCARCGAKAECEIWERPVCYPCAADWTVDAQKVAADGATLKAFTTEWVKTKARAA